MKYLYFIIFTLFTGHLTLGQTTKGIQYSYDASGKRIQRKGITITCPTCPIQRKGLPTDSIANHIIGVFPNPTNGAFNVNIDGYDNNTKVSILLFDMAGKLIKNIPSAGMNNTIDLTNETSGIYTLKVSVSDGVSNWRVVKD